MTTRSGRGYKRQEMSDTGPDPAVRDGASEDELGRVDGVEGGRAAVSPDIMTVVQMLLDDRRRREEEIAEDRARREREMEQRVSDVREQMDAMCKMMEQTGRKKTAGEALVKVAKLADTDDIEGYLLTFERQMIAYEIEETRWAFILAPQLTGKAQKAYVAMAADEVGDYQMVKTAILKRYDISEETHRRKFRARTRAKGESFAELATSLMDLAQKWLAECSTKEEVMERLAIEQFLTSAPENVRVWVRERKPTSCKAAGQLADEYQQARAETTTSVAVKRQERQEPTAKRCHTCHQTGHLSYSCPKTKSAEPPSQPRGTPKQTTPHRQGTDKKIKCYTCGEWGHIAMNCPSNALFCKDEKTEDVLGTEAGDEALRQGTVEGVPVQILLDTGSARTLVRRDLVPEGKVLADETVVVRCAHGESVRYPLADLEIAVQGKRFVIRAGVSDKLPVQLLLGRDAPELFSLLTSSPTSVAKDLSVGSVSSKDRANSVTREVSSTRIGSTTPVSNLVCGKSASIESESPTNVDSDAVVVAVVTRSQTRQKDNTVDDIPGAHFDDELFEGGQGRTRQTKSQKRNVRRQHFVPKDPTASSLGTKSRWDILDMSTEELRNAQQKDQTLATVRAAASGKPNLAVGGGFFLRDGLLYRHWEPRGPTPGKDSVIQLVVPEKCRDAVMAVAHEIPLGGHLGKTKTTQRLLQRFYWPTLYADVAKFCRTCKACQLDSSRRVHKAPLVPLPIISEPFHRIAMDIVGPLPKSRSGKRFILVVCDYATRYPEAVALRSIDAENVAEELIQIFSRVGIPNEILTDQGANFMSRLLAEVYKLLRVKRIRTSPYHPQTDGLVERFNQTLKAMLRKAAISEGKDWDKLLPYVLFAYREVPQASTGFSPFELLYGRPVRGPLDLLRESWETPTTSNESIVSYVLKMREKLARMTELVQENLAKAQTRQKEWYDRTARSREFNPGDRVLVLLPTSTHKLRAQWQGPYDIIRKNGEANYVVDMKDKHKRLRTFHVNMLREWHDDQPLTLFSEEQPDDSGDVLLWKDGSDAQPCINVGLSADQQSDVKQLLAEYADVFSNKPGCTSLAEHRIETGSAKPVRQHPYRLPHAYRDTVQEELRDMLEHGIIETSTSEWASPIVLVPKKDGSLRMCVDYRKLNSVSEADAYPMPRIDELIDRLGGAKFITTLDLTRGYWQVPVAQESRAKTAFTTPFGLYQFTVMPFGLHGAPATFQRIMDSLLNGAGSYSAAYLDDLVIYSGNWQEHLQHLREVLQRLREAGLTAKPAKCQFGTNSCVYLGHIVGGGEVRPEVAKSQAVADFPPPTTKKDVRAFLGLTGYYRRFVPDYATIALPLTDLTRKAAPNSVVWTAECDTAFTELKRRLTSAPVLKSPDFDREFILQTDASERGIGAVLSQRAVDGEEHPIAYYSRKLLPREERYATVEKECLAIKLGVQAFRVYLLGRKFVVQTDHRSLEWLHRLKENNARLTRWSLSLQPYIFTVEHRAGRDNANADGLSRGAISATN